MSSTSAPESEGFDREAAIPGTWALVISLVAAHVGTAFVYAETAGTTLSSALFLDRSVRLRVVVGGQYGPLVDTGEAWRLVRSLWLHADALHLAVNVASIWILGRLLEPWVGSVRWVWWFVVGGVVASLASHGMDHTQSDGASGGAFALLAALAVMGWRRRQGLPPADRTLALRWIPIFVVANLVLSLALPFVDATAHLAGMLTGLMLGGFGGRASRPAETVFEAIGVAIAGAIALLGPYWRGW